MAARTRTRKHREKRLVGGGGWGGVHTLAILYNIVMNRGFLT